LDLRRQGFKAFDLHTVFYREIDMNLNWNEKELKDLTIPQMLKRSDGLFSHSVALSTWKDGKFYSFNYAEL